MLFEIALVVGNQAEVKGLDTEFILEALVLLLIVHGVGGLAEIEEFGIMLMLGTRACVLLLFLIFVVGKPVEAEVEEFHTGVMLETLACVLLLFLIFVIGRPVETEVEGFHTGVMLETLTCVLLLPLVFVVRGCRVSSELDTKLMFQALA